MCIILFTLSNACLSHGIVCLKTTKIIQKLLTLQHYIVSAVFNHKDIVYHLRYAERRIDFKPDSKLEHSSILSTSLNLSLYLVLVLLFQ